MYVYHIDQHPALPKMTDSELFKVEKQARFHRDTDILIQLKFIYKERGIKRNPLNEYKERGIKRNPLNEKT